MEVFCGRANLSKRLRARRFQAISVDHVAAKGVPIFRVDITNDKQRKVLEMLLNLDCILYVHFAPPCGTASAARDIQPGPPPLRSLLFPMGLPGLNFIQKTRVRLANLLYQWTVDMIFKLDAKHVAWSVENPASSLMWVTDPFTRLAKLPKFIAFSFHTCMFQAPRKKDTAIWCSVEQLRHHLERKCDGNHEHARWGRTSSGFATAEECAYNDAISASWAEAIYDYALTRGFTDTPETALHDSVEVNAVTNKALLGCLPRGRKMLPFISDFLQPQVHNIEFLHEIRTLAIGKRIPSSCTVFPLGSKLLRFSNGTGGVDIDNVGLPCFALIGIPREPMEFLLAACRLTHPTAMAMTVGTLLQQNIDRYNEPSTLDLRRFQCSFAQELVKMCAATKHVEEERRSGMCDHVRKILEGKRTALFGELLKMMDYPDAKLAAEMEGGFPLCGWLPASGVFPCRIRPPEISEEFLRQMAKSFTGRTLSSTRESGDPELDENLWSLTLEEVQDGFLSGPYERSELPPSGVVSPRFGLQQKNKLRPIDNFSASHVNGATGLEEKFQVDSIDEICAMIKTWMQRGPEGVRLLGKTYDMRKAYRQIAIREDHLDLAWISVWDPYKKRPALFRMESMPFGATASVGAFLRLSQAIKSIGISLCGLVWSSFFDDFVCICKEGTQVQTDRMVRLLFKTLGWKLSEDPEKDLPFAVRFNALGVEFDLTEVCNGVFAVGNTSSRKDELGVRIDTILSNDELEPAVAESMRSRLLFAEAQIYGRHAKIALQTIGAVGLAKRVVKPLDQKLKRALSWMRRRVLHAAPRIIETAHRTVYFLFLDGACTPVSQEDEWCGTSVGAVLADSNGCIISFFGHVISHDLVRTWGEPDKTQYIFEAEVLPYTLSLLVWKEVIQGCALFAYIDNEAARASWISASAHSGDAMNFIHHGAEIESKLDVRPFFSRVPTHSNFGDAPSRGRFEELLKLGAQQARVSDDMIYALSQSPECGEFPLEMREGAMGKGNT